VVTKAGSSNLGFLLAVATHPSSRRMQPGANSWCHVQVSQLGTNKCDVNAKLENVFVTYQHVNQSRIGLNRPRWTVPPSEVARCGRDVTKEEICSFSCGAASAAAAQ
jgi:hypothetical protein